MTNIDLKKDLKHLYNPSQKSISEVTVPPMSYLMIDGAGDPNTSQTYSDAVSALYTLAYGIRAICKTAGTIFTVMPLEGLWWFEGQPPETPFDMTEADKTRFIWTMMILQPDIVTNEIIEEARTTIARKKNPPLLDKIRLETYSEGESVQIMYIGSYQDEAPTIAKLHDYIKQHGWQLSGKHHEIYLSNPGRVAPEKLKTVIRQPFVRG